MAHPAQHVYETVDEMLKNLKAMSEKHPEAKIGGAASTFNSLLKEAKEELPQSALVREMETLSDQDTLIALATRLSVIKGQAYVAIYTSPSAAGRIRPRPPYA